MIFFFGRLGQICPFWEHLWHVWSFLNIFGHVGIFSPFWDNFKIFGIFWDIFGRFDLFVTILAILGQLFRRSNVLFRFSGPLGNVADERTSSGRCCGWKGRRRKWRWRRGRIGRGGGDKEEEEKKDEDEEEEEAEEHPGAHGGPARPVRHQQVFPKKFYGVFRWVWTDFSWILRIHYGSWMDFLFFIFLRDWWAFQWPLGWVSRSFLRPIFKFFEPKDSIFRIFPGNFQSSFRLDFWKKPENF